MTIRPAPPDLLAVHLLGWCLVLVGAAVGAYTGNRTVDKIAARAWTPATATIVASEMYGRTGRSRDWCIKLQYRYEVGGVVYTSRRIGTSRLGDAGCAPHREVIVARLAGQQPGQPLAINYDPAAPGTAIVYRESVDFLDWFFAALALMMVGGGIWQIRWQPPGNQPGSHSAH